MGEILTFETSKHYIPYGKMVDYNRLRLNGESVATLTYKHYQLHCIPEQYPQNELKHKVTDMRVGIPFVVELTSNTSYHQTGSVLQLQANMIHILKEWDNSITLGYCYHKGSIDSLDVKALNEQFQLKLISAVELSLIDATSDAFPIQVKVACNPDENEIEVLFVWEAPMDKHNEMNELCKEYYPHFSK